MSASFSDNGDSTGVITDGHLDGGVSRSVPGTAVRVPPPRRTAGAHRGTDYRLRGLIIEPTARVPAAPTQPDHHPQRRYRRLAVGAEFGALAAVAALAVWLLQAFVAQPYLVTSATMAPAIQAGDRILIVKAGELGGPIRSGEVVVFHLPKSPSCGVTGGQAGDQVLRVVGTPGQTIWSIGNTIFVNGRPLRERGWYDARVGEVGSVPIPTTTLGRNQYFVMGDNRSDACDSRFFGPISKSSIVGEGIAVLIRHGHVFFRSL
jgi:signal peptidase I